MMGLVFLGLFGPFLLREAGVMRWRDDFQREAVMRSGMHALVAVGVLLTASAILEGGGTDFGQQPSGEWGRIPAGIVLIVLGITWGLSWLLQFWGVRTGAFRILLWTVATYTVIHAGLLIQALALGRGLPWSAGYTASSLLQLLGGWLVVFTSRRWPRATGILLFGIVAWQLREIPTALEVAGYQVAVIGIGLLTLPFLVPAIALLLSKGEQADLGRA
jgi:hypothetical protein